MSELHRPIGEPPSLRASGVDGCPGGWIAVTRHASGPLESRVYAEIGDLFGIASPAHVVGIDIPIGLVDSGARVCDRVARKALRGEHGGGRASSVFPAPIRPVLAASSYAEACRIRERVEGKRMSRQAFGILGKVAEVDRALRSRRHGEASVREVHPELSFRALAGHPLRFPKRSREGRAERLRWIDGHFGACTFEALRRNHPRVQVADDDLIDALAVLWTAERVARGDGRTLPEAPPLDRYGLPMEIVF